MEISASGVNGGVQSIRIASSSLDSDSTSWPAAVDRQKKELVREASNESLKADSDSPKRVLSRLSRSLCSPLKGSSKVLPDRSKLSRLGKSLSFRSARDSHNTTAEDCSETARMEKSRSYNELDSLDDSTIDAAARLILEVKPAKKERTPFLRGLLSSPSSPGKKDGSDDDEKPVSTTRVLGRLPRRTMSIESMGAYDPLMIASKQATPVVNPLVTHAPVREKSDAIESTASTTPSTPIKSSSSETNSSGETSSQVSSGSTGGPNNLDSILLPFDIGSTATASTGPVDGGNRRELARHFSTSIPLPQVSEEASLASSAPGYNNGFQAPDPLVPRPRNMQHRAVSQESLLSLGGDSLCTTTAMANTIIVPDLSCRGGSVSTLDYNDHPSIGGVGGTRDLRSECNGPPMSPSKVLRMGSSSRNCIRRCKSHSFADMQSIAEKPPPAGLERHGTLDNAVLSEEVSRQPIPPRDTCSFRRSRSLDDSGICDHGKEGDDDDDDDAASLYSIHNALLEKKPLLRRLGNSFRRNSQRSVLVTNDETPLTPVRNSSPQRLRHGHSTQRQAIEVTPSASPMRSSSPLQRVRRSFSFRKRPSQASIVIDNVDDCRMQSSPQRQRQRFLSRRNSQNSISADMEACLSASDSIQRQQCGEDILRQREKEAYMATDVVPLNAIKRPSFRFNRSKSLMNLGASLEKPGSSQNGLNDMGMEADDSKTPRSRMFRRASTQNISSQSNLGDLEELRAADALPLNGRKRASFRINRSKSLVNLDPTSLKGMNGMGKEADDCKAPRSTMFRRASAKNINSQSHLGDLEKPTAVKAERLEERKSALTRLGRKLRNSFSQRGIGSDGDTLSAGFTLDFTTQSKQEAARNRTAILAPAITRKRSLLRPLCPTVRMQVPESLLVDTTQPDDVSSLEKQSFGLGYSPNETGVSNNSFHDGVPSTICIEMASSSDIESLGQYSAMTINATEHEDHTDNALMDIEPVNLYNQDNTEFAMMEENVNRIVETPANDKSWVVPNNNGALADTKCSPTGDVWEHKYRMAILETEALRAILDADQRLTAKLEKTMKYSDNAVVTTYLRRKRELKLMTDQTKKDFA